LESIVTGPNDEWPIHPDNEWPVRPDPKSVSDDKPNLARIYVPPDETETPPAPMETKPSKRAQYIRRKKLDTAKPRRALITDDMQIVIDMSTHHDRTTKDGEWPVMQRKTPEPTFDPYEPDKSEEPYLPHVPLSEEPTYFQRIRRTAWVIGCFMLITTVFSMIIGFFYPDETAYPDVQIFFAVVSGVCFVIAYSEQLFLGDH
jgi:hypothetical protein